MSQSATETRVSGSMNENTPELEALKTKPERGRDLRMRELVDLLATAVARVLGGEIAPSDGEPQP